MRYEIGPNPNQIQHGAFSRKSHKYIAKIGEGIKARYFYTQEELNAYKNALSSKDEKAAVDKRQKQYDKASKASDIANAQYKKASQERANAYADMAKADGEYRRAQSERSASQRIGKESIKGTIKSTSKQKGLKNKVHELTTGEKYQKQASDKQDQASKNRIKATEKSTEADNKQVDAYVNAHNTNLEKNEARKKLDKAQDNYDSVTKLGGRSAALSKELDKHGHKTAAKGASKVSKMLSKIGNMKISDSTIVREAKYHVITENMNGKDIAERYGDDGYDFDRTSTRTEKTVNDILQNKTGKITTSRERGTRYGNISVIDDHKTVTQYSTRKKKKKK